MVNQPRKVAKTGAERVRAYRERLKANEVNFNVYKAKDNERKKKDRKRSILSPSEVTRQMIEAKEETIKHDTIEEVSKAYQTPQALGKAICKVRKHLPTTPERERQ